MTSPNSERGLQNTHKHRDVFTIVETDLLKPLPPVPIKMIYSMVHIRVDKSFFFIRQS